MLSKMPPLQIKVILAILALANSLIRLTIQIMQTKQELPLKFKRHLEHEDEKNK